MKRQGNALVSLETQLSVSRGWWVHAQAHAAEEQYSVQQVYLQLSFKTLSPIYFLLLSLSLFYNPS